jgi:hypothetical protein
VLVPVVPLLLFLSVVPVVVLEAAPVVPDVIGLEELERSIVVATAVPLPNVVTSVVVVVENELVKVVPGAVVLPVVVSTPLNVVVSFNICTVLLAGTPFATWMFAILNGRVYCKPSSVTFTSKSASLPSFCNSRSKVMYVNSAITRHEADH